MVLVFGSPSDQYGYRQSIIFVLLLLPVLAGTTYLFLNYLVPQYLLKRRFLLFGLYSLYSLIVAAWLELMILVGMFVLMFELQMELLNPKITDLGYLAGTMFLIILPAVTIQATRQWYRERERSDRLKQEKLELELYARQKELDYLKEQIRPHFLFNVLNSLYGLTLEKSDKAPELVLKVSEMLDYMLYRSSAKRVPLEDEIEHITNYIEIQKIRYEDRLQLKLDISQGEKQYLVAPMLLLPFVENSFKHGFSSSSTGGFVEIRLDVVDDELHFEITNSCTDNTGNGSEGLGLKNVEKRLTLLYDENYKLHTEQSEDQFRVDLTLPVTRSNG